MSTVQAAPPCLIVDTDVKLTPNVISAIEAQGYKGIVRYVPLPGMPAASDIDSVELGAILEAGLGLMLVQHVRRPPWDPGQHSGARDATTAVQAAQMAGYLRGAHLFLDLEGISGNGPDTKAFAEAWAAVIVGAGYAAGCYVGYGVPLGPQELYDLKNINSYWSDVGAREVAVRGFAVKQRGTIQISGVPFDPDAIQADELGATPLWMSASDENG